MSGTVNQESLRAEFRFLWQAHQAHGLQGKMALYTLAGQEPWRVAEENVCLWFGEDETDSAIAALIHHYNEGKLPNSPLLLNPIIHDLSDPANPRPLGSGIMWGTSFALGIHQLSDEASARLQTLGVGFSTFQRMENNKAGVKILARSTEILPAGTDGRSVDICDAFYQLVNLDAPAYAPYYLLSGIKYLSLHGSFIHEDFSHLKTEEKQAINPQSVRDAAYCWNAYDRTHSLFMKWGSNPDNVEKNNRFFNLCARDVMLFDSTGPMRAAGGDEKFEFLVPGLIPRGAICVLAASGGTGKSSIAHELCIHCAKDYAPDEAPPFWLGQPVNVDAAKDGICVYFSGEDGPAIINARAELYDPEGRAQRLQFHRSDFGGENVSFADFIMKRLMKMPNIPLIVIDPARKYLSGNEDDSDVVSEFFYALEELAMAKNAAVVVVHHLKRGAKPTSIPEVLDELRGSQVFIDRARVVIGMFREGQNTIVGLAKNNIPPTLGMVTEERVFVRNPKTLRLVWVPGEGGVRNKPISQADIEQMEYEAFKQQVEQAKQA